MDERWPADWLKLVISERKVAPGRGVQLTVSMPLCSIEIPKWLDYKSSLHESDRCVDGSLRIHAREMSLSHCAVSALTANAEWDDASRLAHC